MKVLSRSVLVPGVAGLAVLLSGALAVTGWIDLSVAAELLRLHAGPVAIFVLGAVLIATAAIRALSKSPHRRSAPALTWWLIMVCGFAVAAVTWIATDWLLREAGQTQDPASARMEAIKTGLTIGAGVVGIFALLLAVRRQWHQELSAAAAEVDAEAKRITELYTKAVDQLGSPQAPVRLAGLYALERLAQDNPEQRKTVTNVFCAYLRMPYQLPDGRPADDADENVVSDYKERMQEREVRRTAQRLLTEHLRDDDTVGPGRFWEGVELDLSGAVLVDFTLFSCRVDRAVFESATFIGRVDFTWTYFGFANFDSATFKNHANFGGTGFGAGYFHSTTFMGEANFFRAAFMVSGFRHTVFQGEANFESTIFEGMTYLESLTFEKDANFSGAVFKSSTHGDAPPQEIAQYWSPPEEEDDE